MSEELDKIYQAENPVDPQKADKDPFAEEVIVAFTAGMSQREIARALSITRYRVRKIADEYGLAFNPEQTESATEAHAAHARLDRAQLEERFSSLAHTELDLAEDATDANTRYIHIRSAAIALDKSLAISESNHKLGHGADDAEEGKRLVGIQLAMMQDQASRVREIMLDPTPGKKQPDTNDPFGRLRVAGEEPP